MLRRGDRSGAQLPCPDVTSIVGDRLPEIGDRVRGSRSRHRTTFEVMARAAHSCCDGPSSPAGSRATTASVATPQPRVERAAIRVGAGNLVRGRAAPLGPTAGNMDLLG